MRLLSMFLGLSIIGSLAVAGCGSDSDSGTQNTAGTAGAAATQCAGIYAEFSASAFATGTTSGKGCAADEAEICGTDVTTIVGTVGASCYQNPDHSDGAQDACVQAGIADQLKTLSAACTNCYVADVACARDKCLADCGLSPGSVKCAQCRAENGCASSFYDCSGLPVPTGTDLGGAGASGE